MNCERLLQAGASRFETPLGASCVGGFDRGPVAGRVELARQCVPVRRLGHGAAGARIVGGPGMVGLESRFLIGRSAGAGQAMGAFALPRLRMRAVAVLGSVVSSQSRVIGEGNLLFLGPVGRGGDRIGNRNAFSAGEALQSPQIRFRDPPCRQLALWCRFLFVSGYGRVWS